MIPLLRARLLFPAVGAILTAAEPIAVTIGQVDWTATPQKVACTASTVEVDVMPFLGRTPEGGPFDAYYEALSDLGAEYVRYAPWYPYPRVVVAELDPPDCTATTPATNWNSELFDGIVRDFMTAGERCAVVPVESHFRLAVSPLPRD